MKTLYLSDLLLMLTDLLDDRPGNKRLKLFDDTLTSKLYRPLLQQHLDELRALPPEWTGGRPFTEEMGRIDVSHDGFGGAFIEMMGAYLRIPTLSDERRKKIETALREFASGGLSELKASYPDEASLAKERQPKLGTYAALLKEFPLADGMTVYDLVSEQIQHGISLDQKMSERASAENESSRPQAGRLRGAIIGSLYRCRAALTDELKLRRDLPENMIAQIFGYADELDAKRAETNRQAAEKKAPSTTPA